MQLLLPILVGVSVGSMSGLGLVLLAWIFRRSEPEAWRRLAARRRFNMALGSIAILATSALFWLAPGHWTGLAFALVIGQWIWLLMMICVMSLTRERKSIDRPRRGG